MTTRVVNVKYEDYDVRICRPGQWGNPFYIGTDGTRAQVIEKYREWIMTQPQLLTQLPMLIGQRLGCYCTPLACHGDVLAELCNQEEKRMKRAEVLRLRGENKELEERVEALLEIELKVRTERDRLKVCLALAREVGQYWRNNWSDFDGRSLRDQMVVLRQVANGEMTAAEYRHEWGLNAN